MLPIAVDRNAMPDEGDLKLLEFSGLQHASIGYPYHVHQPVTILPPVAAHICLQCMLAFYDAVYPALAPYRIDTCNLFTFTQLILHKNAVARLYGLHNLCMSLQKLTSNRNLACSAHFAGSKPLHHTHVQYLSTLLVQHLRKLLPSVACSLAPAIEGRDPK